MAKSKARAFFEDELLPAFVARFGPDKVVLNIGAGKHTYREQFRCSVVTCDPYADAEVSCFAEAMPFADDWYDGVLMMGVFERLDDPMQAMREARRVLRPGGFMLMSALDLGFGWRKESDRWRLSPAGAAHVVRGFTVIAYHQIESAAHFFVLQKP